MSNEPVTLPPGMTQEAFEKLAKKFIKKQAEKPKNTGVVVFADWESGNQKLRVYKDEFKGREILSIRKFWLPEGEADYQPGKGVTFFYEDIDLIIEGLQKMKEYCEEHPRED